MIAYKGFHPGLICRGYQFVMGLNTTAEANCGDNGFHCAENPLDCLSYYGDIMHSEYYLVQPGGDAYFVLHDFDAYDKAFWEAQRVYGDRDEWLRRAVLNTAKSGYFSSDRTIAEYNDAIWHLEPVGDFEDVPEQGIEA